MQLNAFRYFLETASTGSVRKAAERLHVAPTAIGRQIENLEHFLGAPVFERGTHGMRLTPAGEILRRRLGAVMHDLDSIKSEIVDVKGLRHGKVALHAAEALSTGFLVPVIDPFRTQYPGITFSITAAGADQTFEALLADTTDIGLTLSPVARPGIEVVASTTLLNVAAVAPRHPLARRKRIGLAELAKHPLALPDVAFGARRALDKAAKAEGLRLNAAVVVNSLTVMSAFARAGGVVAVLPMVSIKEELRTGSLVPIRLDNELAAAVGVSLCVHQGRQPSFAASRFLEAATKSFDLLAARPGG